MDLASLERLLRLFSFDHTDDLWWREGKTSLHFFVQCSDTYWWATADLEEIRLPDDLDSLERAKSDAANHLFWPVLWVSRKRGLRPMKAWYDSIVSDDDDAHMRALLDAAGPERVRADEN